MPTHTNATLVEPTDAPAPTTSTAVAGPRLHWSAEPDLDHGLLPQAQYVRARWICLAITIAVGCFSTLFELNDYRVPTSHEAFAMVPAREMRLSGDWLLPTFGQRPRLEKPPLVYWSLAALGTFAGDVEPWLARLPSALATLMLSLLMGVWAGRRFGWSGGIAAGLAVSTSGFLVTYGRKAEIDVPLCLMTTTALFLIAHEPDRESLVRSLARWTAVFALLGLTWLCKWHFGAAMVLGPFVVFQLVQRTPRRLLRLLQPIGLPLFLACMLVWPYLILQREPGAIDVWLHETVDRALPGTFRDDPWWYYGPHLLSFTLPWTPFIIVGMVSSWRRAWRESDARDRFLWVTIGVQFAILMLSSNKHRHYLLATMPLLSLFTAEVIARLVKRLQSRRLPITTRQATIASLVTVPVAFGAWFRAYVDYPAFGPTFAWMALIGGAMVAGVIWLYHARRGVTAVAVSALGFIVIHGAAHAYVMPRIDSNRELYEFAEDVRERIGPDDEVRLLSLGTTPLVEYLGSPTRRTNMFPPERIGRETRFVVTHHEKAEGVFAAVPGRIVVEQPGKKRKRLVLLELERPVGGPLERPYASPFHAMRR